VGGDVAAAQIFLYDWWPIRAEARLFDRLSAMPVRIAYTKTPVRGVALGWPAASAKPVHQLAAAESPRANQAGAAGRDPST
jgi:hypothetical protein